MKKKRLAIVLFSCILLVGLILGGYLFNLSHKPLGTPLLLEAHPTITAPSTLEGMAAPSSTAVRTAEATSDKVCGQRGATTILIIGSDAGDLHGRPGSDLTRLARVDFSHKRVNTFALPRDLWVDVEGLGFNHPLLTETTLGEVYYEAHERSAQAEEAGKMTDGVQFSAQMILDNFNVTSDHYIVVDLNRLPDLIDAIGGLPIDIPEQTTDPWIGTVIEAGPQLLTGEQLKAYARAIPDSDFARIQRNNLILHALRQKLLDPEVWIKLPALYDEFNKMIVTDLSPELIFSFLCLLKEVPREEIVMQQVESEWTSPGPSDSLLWKKDKVATALKQLDLIP